MRHAGVFQRALSSHSSQFRAKEALDLELKGAAASAPGPDEAAKQAAAVKSTKIDK